jgi:hypothetical protein
MKIAYILRGQTRNTITSARLFNKYTRGRLLEHDHTVHIYTWNHTNDSSRGQPNTTRELNADALAVQLNSLYSPETLTIGDDGHYKDLIIPFAQSVDWSPVVVYSVLNQIIADLRAQDQLLEYCNLHDYTPDLIVDTRPELFHWVHKSFYADSKSTLDNNPNSVLTHKLTWTAPDSMHQRYVSDYTFVYNMDTLRSMTTENSTTRVTNALYSESNMDLMSEDGSWSSHTLYPSIVHNKQNYILMSIASMVPTVVIDERLEHEIHTTPPSSERYYSYSELQPIPSLSMKPTVPRDIDAIHTSILNNS